MVGSTLQYETVEGSVINGDFLEQATEEDLDKMVHVSDHSPVVATICIN